MDLTQKNFKELFIGKDVNRTSSVTPATLAEGEIALFSVNGTLITSSNAGDFDTAVIMKGTTDGKPQISDRIKKASVYNAVGKSGVALSEQVSYVGYNGTDGALDTTNDTMFILRFIFRSYTVSSNRGEYFKHSQWLSPLTGTTQEKVAVGLQKSIINNFDREADRIIKAELVNSGSKTAIGTSAGAAVFTNGSTIVSFTDVDNATTNAVLAVGELIGTNDVYGVIKSIDTTANTVTLTVPWQGASGSVANGNVDRITAATAAAGDYGIKLTGITPKGSVGRFIPKLTTFEITLQNFAETEVTKIGGNPGSSTADIVAQQEFFYQGNTGDPYRYGRNTFTPRSEVENILYDSICIDWKDSVTVGALDNIPMKQVEVVIPAAPSNNQYSVATSGIKAAFDAFFGISLSL